MFEQQIILEVPDEADDSLRKTTTDMHNYTIAFHNALEVFGYAIVSHRELQDSWEEVVINRSQQVT